MKPTYLDLSKKLVETQDKLDVAEKFIQSQSTLLAEASQKATEQEKEIECLREKNRRIWAFHELLIDHIHGQINF